MSISKIIDVLANSSGFLSKVARSFQVLSKLSEGLQELNPIWNDQTETQTEKLEDNDNDKI
jgi:hypothetical protein